MVDITNPIFHDEAKALAHLEASRWPSGPFCPYCGSLNVHRMAGKTQAGYFMCNDCRDKFTARVGSVMERSHIPVHKWLLGHAPDGSQQEGHVVQAAPAHAQRELQIGLVSQHANSRSHARRRRRPAWWRGQGAGERRDVRRRQEEERPQGQARAQEACRACAG